MNRQPQAFVISSPVGSLRLQVEGEMISTLQFLDESDSVQTSASAPSSLLKEAANQLKEYFNGRRKQFDLPLAMTGTAFEKEVWSQLRHIPFGNTITYKKLAQRLGDDKKVRAVGRANGKNPLPILVPCHRVIGKNDKLTGYAGGIERKKWLLHHEGALLL